jgi:hypothetical protein
MRIPSWISKTTHAHAHAHAHAPWHSPKHARTHACVRTHTHRKICNTYCFSTATIVSQNRLIVTLYVHCLYCIYFRLIFVFKSWRSLICNCNISRPKMAKSISLVTGHKKLMVSIRTSHSNELNGNWNRKHGSKGFAFPDEIPWKYNKKHYTTSSDSIAPMT